MAHPPLFPFFPPPFFSPPTARGGGGPPPPPPPPPPTFAHRRSKFSLRWSSEKVRSSGLVVSSLYLKCKGPWCNSRWVWISIFLIMLCLFKGERKAKTQFLKKSFLWKHMTRCYQIAIFLDVNLSFNLIVTEKTSAPKQFERPPFWKPCWRLGRIAWRHCAREAQVSRRQHHQMQNGSGRGSSNRTPRDFKRGIRFHRLPLKNKSFLKE